MRVHELSCQFEKLLEEINKYIYIYFFNLKHFYLYIYIFILLFQIRTDF